MRYPSNAEKKAKEEEEARRSAEAAENRRRIVALAEELLPKIISRPEYPEENRELMRKGGESFIRSLKGAK